ncbi:hypothetical protein WH47_00175 [Habropoda laboriosa]|uniref:Uncharacterized protein n=1 Tax=Habropoda laboriosa TaxID=597456 RepID=A0A0L7R1F0_9HYME|nr:hypothetical protein WH47_00175 [Habropoda laboriosa]
MPMGIGVFRGFGRYSSSIGHSKTVRREFGWWSEKYFSDLESVEDWEVWEFELWEYWEREASGRPTRYLRAYQTPSTPERERSRDVQIRRRHRGVWAKGRKDRKRKEEDRRDDGPREDYHSMDDPSGLGAVTKSRGTQQHARFADAFRSARLPTGLAYLYVGTPSSWGSLSVARMLLEVVTVVPTRETRCFFVEVPERTPLNQRCISSTSHCRLSSLWLLTSERIQGRGERGVKKRDVEKGRRGRGDPRTKSTALRKETKLERMIEEDSRAKSTAWKRDEEEEEDPRGSKDQVHSVKKRDVEEEEDPQSVGSP